MKNIYIYHSSSSLSSFSSEFLERLLNKRQPLLVSVGDRRLLIRSQLLPAEPRDPHVPVALEERRKRKRRRKKRMRKIEVEEEEIDDDVDDDDDDVDDDEEKNKRKK